MQKNISDIVNKLKGFLAMSVFLCIFVAFFKEDFAVNMLRTDKVLVCIIYE